MLRRETGRRKERLYEKHSGKMLSICRQYVKDLQHAEEVMLNGFLKVFTHLEDFRNEGSFEGWMRKIMIREAISFLRTDKRICSLKMRFLKTRDFSYSFTSEFNAAHIQEIDRQSARRL